MGTEPRTCPTTCATNRPTSWPSWWTTWWTEEQVRHVLGARATLDELTGSLHPDAISDAIADAPDNASDVQVWSCHYTLDAGRAGRAGLAGRLELHRTEADADGRVSMYSGVALDLGLDGVDDLRLTLSADDEGGVVHRLVVRRGALVRVVELDVDRPWVLARPAHRDVTSALLELDRCLRH